MTTLIVAAEYFADFGSERHVSLAASLLAGLGYGTAVSSSRVAERAADDAIEKATLEGPTADAIERAKHEVALFDEALESPPEGQKYTVLEGRRRAVNRVDELQAKAQGLALAQLGSATRCRRWADWMLFLMVVGVAGGTGLVFLHLLVASALVYGIGPVSFVAYWRLKNAISDATGMVHSEKMRQLEYREKELELQHKQQELELTRDTKRLEVLQKRIELEAGLVSRSEAED